ncbi:MAG: hypothetical protein HDQ99_12085 [Lachnospiraceae bacterium]|nr:hypothetical protein [Lachnospiraceae bacterium]
MDEEVHFWCRCFDVRVLVIEGEFFVGKDGGNVCDGYKKGVHRGGFRQKITFRRVNYYNWGFEGWGGGIIYVNFNEEF